MAEFIHLQSDFTLGQLNEKLHSRVDSEIYLRGARKIRNMVVTPEGGLLKRFGLEFGILADDIEGDITAANSQFIILETTPIEKLVIVFSPEKVNILDVDTNGKLKILQTLSTVFTTPQIPDLRFAQSRGVLLVFHEDVTFQRLARPTGAAPSSPTFVFGEVPIKNVPAFGFDEQTIDGFTFNVSNKGDIGRGRILTSSSPLFTEEFEGGLFVAEGGVMRLTGPIGVGSPSTTITGTVVTKFTLGMPDGSNIPGKESFISQKAISDLRGWPKDGVFFDSRLWLIGLKSLPNAVFGSAVEDFFNFSTVNENAGDAIDDILQAKSLTFIKGGIGNKGLIAFTNDGPFATQIPLEGALTPSNTAFAVQGGQTIDNLPALTLDNKVIFINDGGKIVWGMSYSEELRGYSIINLSITGSDVINQPVSSTIFKGDPENNTSYLFIVNADGTLAVFTSDEEAKVNGWTLCETDGNFKKVFALGRFAFVLVERNNQLIIEKIDFNSFMDSVVLQTFSPPQTLVGNLGHLEGKAVEVIADGVLQPFDTTTTPGQPGSSIVQNGQVFLKSDATVVEAGLPFTLEIIPLPVNVRTDSGDDLNLPKTVKNATISFFESLGIRVNGVLLRGQEFSDTDFINLAVPITGSEKRKIAKGWDPTAIHVTVTQTRPLPCYIRSIDIQMDI